MNFNWHKAGSETERRQREREKKRDRQRDRKGATCLGCMLQKKYFGLE